MEEKEAQLQTQVERRDEADKAAAAAKEQYREEYAKRVAVEQAQQDTRRTWAAEKRKRESIEQELVVLQGRFEEREAEMLSKLEEQLSKRGDLTKKETKEILKSLKAELKVKWESALLDARQSAMERVGSED